MKHKQHEYHIIFWTIITVFAVFLCYPIISLLLKSFQASNELSLINYTTIFASQEFIITLGNSIVVSFSSACITVILAFILAFCVNYTNLWKPLKNAIVLVAGLPMLLPTITYGFAIIYSFGKEGLLTKLFGFQLFSVYGFQGILLGYVIYTLPIAFMLLHNAMKYIDKKFITVSRLMGDSTLKTFHMTLLKPLIGTFGAALIQAFFLSFTDFGIPASVGGKYHVLSSLLYSYMLGSIPDFAQGSVIAMAMLIPSILSILTLRYVERYNVRYKQVSDIPIRTNKIRDGIYSICSLGICIATLSIFAVVFVMPFVKQWPYQLEFTWEHVRAVFTDTSLLLVFKNSLWVAILTSIVGTLLAYGCALLTERSKFSKAIKKLVESIALTTNTIPGMVMGIAYLFIFSGTSLQNTILIMVICNVIHFFSTPFLMMKGTLSKMNSSFETTAKLMGDSWFRTITKIITPNASGSLLEVFSYYFVNSMVTISAIIFIAGAKTMVITTKIKELQYFSKYNEIFVLSLLILFTNLFAKFILQQFAKKRKRKL